MSAYPIYDLSLAVAARLKAKGIAAEVYHDSDRVSPAVPNAPHVRFAHDDEAGDVFDEPVTAAMKFADGNDVRMARASMVEGVVVDVLGSSTRTGASAHAHKGAVRRLALEHVLVAIKVILNDARMPAVEMRGTFVPTSEGKRQHGAHYQLRFGMQSLLSEKVAQMSATPLVAVPTVVGRLGDAEEIACGPPPAEGPP